MKILMVEDDRELLRSILLYFNEFGYICETAKSFSDAEDKISEHEYDCIILDLGLPDRNGLDLLPVISRKNNDTGVIILSANSNLDDKVKGLDMGADDYLTKPFHLSELNSRIKSIIRRKKQQGTNILEYNEISINTDSKEVRVNDQFIRLTKREYDLLLYLYYNRNRVVTKTSISEHLWGDFMDAADSADSVYSHIKNLKRKLGKNGPGDYIKSLYGVGYIFKDD
ncbi:MAG: response regulator transcription factor [Crocinitomicaceae bacterium]|nr:response regulator transcription factor [Crocinitomicaceae bacterium]